MKISEIFKRDFKSLWPMMGSPHRMESSNTEPGIPDYLMFVPGRTGEGNRLVAVELKSKTDRVRDSQKAYTSRHGCTVYVLRNCADGLWDVGILSKGVLEWHVRKHTPTQAYGVIKCLST